VVIEQLLSASAWHKADRECKPVETRWVAARSVATRESSKAGRRQVALTIALLQHGELG
jgi:hypothetical protein